MGPAADRWFDVAPPGWDALLASDPNGGAAHRPALAAAFGAALPGFTPHFLSIEHAGERLGGTVVLIERRAGFHWLHALPMLLPGAPLAGPGAHAEVDRRVARAFAALARELGAVGGEWACYRPAGPTVATDALSVLPGTTRVLEASVVDLTHGTAEALRRMDRKHRQELRRARERGDLGFAEDAGALDEVYALHERQGRDWRGHRALPVELSRRLLAPDPGGPVARLFTLRDARGLLSGALALDHPHEVLVWWSGTHADGRHRHAFPLLLWSIVEWAAERGRARVNLGASTDLHDVATFKLALGAEGVRYPVRWIAGAARGPARLLAAFQQRLRRGRPFGELA